MSTAAQLTLFEPAKPDYWERLKEARERLMRTPRSRNTLRAYAHTWNVFTRWAEEAGSTALPATTESVSNFLAWCLYERKYRISTVVIALNAIAYSHAERRLPSPVTPEVKQLLRNARRDLRERRRGKKPLSPEDLREVCGLLAESGRLVDARDRAMILMQFAAGWRCSEIVSLDRADVHFQKQGYVLSLGASKTDQDASEGRVVGIDYGDSAVTCPVRALQEWLKLRGEWKGPLFCRVRHVPWDGRGPYLQRTRLKSGDVVNEQLKKALARIGIDAKAYGSHSLRSGMVTAGIESGASETAIMLRTGHKEYRTLRRYVRPAKAFRANPLKGVL